MTTNQQELKRIVESAIGAFNTVECYLIENDVSERCICAKLALHLQNILLQSAQFNEYIVDVEYNRGAKGKDYEPKRLSDNSSPITVDLIIHKRGSNHRYCFDGIDYEGCDNLVCIEMKKSNNMRNYDEDKQRLDIMTKNSSRFAYKIGFAIISDKKQRKLRIDQEFINDYCS